MPLGKQNELQRHPKETNKSENYISTEYTQTPDPAIQRPTSIIRKVLKRSPYINHVALAIDPAWALATVAAHVLRLRGMILQLLGGVLFAKGRNLVEVPLCTTTPGYIGNRQQAIGKWQGPKQGSLARAI